MASAVLAFVTSSIDDFFLLACLYAEPQAHFRRISAAKLACALLALVVAVLLATACLALPLSLSRTAGLVPLALGAKRLLDTRVASLAGAALSSGSAAPAGTTSNRSLHSFTRLLSILLAASLDNIALYMPLFADGNRTAIALAVAIVLPMTMLLCALAFVSSRIRWPFLRARSRLDAAVPYLMMFIGIKALAGSFI